MFNNFCLKHIKEHNKNIDSFFFRWFSTHFALQNITFYMLNIWQHWANKFDILLFLYIFFFQEEYTI